MAFFQFSFVPRRVSSPWPSSLSPYPANATVAVPPRAASHVALVSVYIPLRNKRILMFSWIQLSSACFIPKLLYSEVCRLIRFIGKIKCDRGLPCRPCLRSRASLLCTYKSNHTPSSGPETRSPLELDLMHEAEIASDISERSQSGDAASLIEPMCMSRDDDTATPSLLHRVGLLEQIIQTPPHSLPQASSVKELEARISRIEQRIGGLSSEPGPSDKSEPRIKLPRPHLRAEHEKTRLFGKTHWVHSLEQVPRRLPSVSDRRSS